MNRNFLTAQPCERTGDPYFGQSEGTRRNAAASRRYPVTPYKSVPSNKRPLWRRQLDTGLWWALAMCFVALLAVHLGPNAYRQVAGPALESLLMWVLKLAAVALALNFWIPGRKDHLEHFYDPLGLAEIPGFYKTDRIYLSRFTEHEETLPDEALLFLPRNDGVMPAEGLPRVKAASDLRLDLRLDLHEQLLFTDRHQGPRPANTLPDSQAALLSFASGIEQALDWREGRVWVMEPPTLGEDTGVLQSLLLIQGGNQKDIDAVCDAIAKARDAVLARYDCGEFFDEHDRRAQAHAGN